MESIVVSEKPPMCHHSDTMCRIKNDPESTSNAHLTTFLKISAFNHRFWLCTENGGNKIILTAQRSILAQNIYLQ